MDSSCFYRFFSGMSVLTLALCAIVSCMISSQQGHPEQLNGGDYDWLIQTTVSTVQRGMLMQPDADTCTPGHRLCIQFSAERAANVVPSTKSNGIIYQWRHKVGAGGGPPRVTLSRG